jgi:peptidoglycan/xylan/chitin deacetylase (PgdA/CDA1 family)
MIAAALALTFTACAEPMSHLTPHLAAEAMSHAGAHRPGQPPAALLLPLGNGVDGVLKGLQLADEARLTEALAQADLHCRILRVGVGRTAGARMALIKLQAGDQRTGEFSVASMNEDAARALGVAFACSLALDHVDLWAVVPGAGMVGDEQENFPVFAVSTPRWAFERSDARAETPRDLLARLDVVRYSPLLLDYATDGGDDTALPRSAITVADFAQNWDALIAEANGARAREAMDAQNLVSAIFQGDPNTPEVALTIDDGPHPLVTPLMLEVLAREGVKATFFVVGQKVEQYPELVRMIARAGHELANHAYSNRRLNKLPADEAWAEIVACQRVVERLSGRQMTYYRPPGGRCSPHGLRAVAARGYTVALWSRNTGDWRKPPAETIVRNATTGLKAGDIILMHQGEMCSVDALPGIIRGVRALGLEPVPLADLGSNGGIVRDTPERVSAVVNGEMLGEE